MKNIFNGRNIVLFATFVIALVLVTPKVEAKPYDFMGGVANEYEYEEVFFLDWYPIHFTGKVTATERVSRNTITTTYRFTLSNPAGDKLTRNIVYTTDVDERVDKGQTTSQTSVKSYTEKVTIGKDVTYTLDDYQFSEGVVSDNRPASDYYSGNLIADKVYTVANRAAKTSDKITVRMTARSMGYENFWGATDTQIVDHQIDSIYGQAFVTTKVSDSKSRVLKYEKNEPDLSSFVGGYSVISTSGMVSEYTYNIPYGAGKGTIKLSRDRTPKIERLIVPKFRDLNNYWAKDSIEKLYSLGILDESSQFFSPNTPMNRYQYAVGVLRAVDLRVLDDSSKKSNARKSLFKDIDVKDPNYSYIESAVNQGVINGVSVEKFDPNDSITRIQAVAILVRALGMEGRAPTPGYKLNFADNGKIPAWGKDSVYVATELGLIYGDSRNRFNPNQPLTRAEASVIMARFLDFLENDLKQNYRDDMFFYN